MMTNAMPTKNSKGETFYLHSKIVHLRGSIPVPIYFMMKASQLDDAEKNNCKAEPELPDGYYIKENTRNNMLTLIRKQEGDHKNG